MGVINFLFGFCNNYLNLTFHLLGWCLDMCDNTGLNNKIDNEKKVLDFLYQTSMKMRDFEITQLGNRNNFFMIFQGVLLAGFMQAAGSSPHPVIVFMICSCGFMISVLQTGMASGAKFWQIWWEEKLKNIESTVDSILENDPSRGDIKFNKLFRIEEKDAISLVKSSFRGCGLINDLIICKFSVSRIPIYAGIVFSLVWLVLLLASTTLQEFSPHFIIGFSKPDGK